MSKKNIKRPQKYVKPKDPTFKEWWAKQSEKTQKTLKAAAIAVVAVILLSVIFYYGFYDDGSLKVKSGEIVGAEDSWLILEKDGGKNSDYYHVANVTVPEGYTRNAESAAGVQVTGTSLDNDFTLNPVDETMKLSNLYIRAINKSVDDMVASVYETFVGIVGEDGTISEIGTFDTELGQAKYFTYKYSAEDTEEQKTYYYQCRVCYIPSLQKDVCVLVSASYFPETEDYATEESLAAVVDLGISCVEMVKK